MAYNRSHAIRLCNAAELSLFDASTRGELGSWSEKQLNGKLTRARRLRDKQQDLLRRQKLATRARTGSKLGRSGVANARTEQKLKLFSEMLARFETRLAALQQERVRAEARAVAAARKVAAKKAAGKASAKKPAGRVVSKKAPRKASAPKTAVGEGFVSARARDASHRTQLQKSRARPIQAHIGSAGKRAQARRDKR